MPAAPVSKAVKSASLIVVDPSGRRTRVELRPVPFKIGRQADNHLVVRDSRASRIHAQIVLENGAHILEDLQSRHGVFVNGARISRHSLGNSDRIEFGFPDSYQLIFAVDGAELNRLIKQISPTETEGRRSAPGSANLAKLRAVMEVARTLETSFSMQDVLAAVVDAALAVTGAERGFLLLRRNGDLETRVARDNHGNALADTDLRVPRRVIHRALQQRRELLSMNFDPHSQTGMLPEHSVADLELRSVVCVPLVRLAVHTAETTRALPVADDTVGVLYMDSRLVAADLTGGNRELLQSLAIEASTILENARLLGEERLKQKIDEELRVARGIQQNLRPRVMPQTGWFRAAGSSAASYEVGGDYFDVIPVGAEAWVAVVADVAGKGVSSALLASLLQGAFLTVSDDWAMMNSTMQRINVFLNERAGDGKFATIFYGLLDSQGGLHYINAGHCAPIVVGADGTLEYLETTAMPVGLVEAAPYRVAVKRLSSGDKVIIYTDGVTEAENMAGEFFGRKRLRQIITAHAAPSCIELHDAVQESVKVFTEGAPQSDDITLVVLEYRPEHFPIQGQRPPVTPAG